MIEIKQDKSMTECKLSGNIGTLCAEAITMLSSVLKGITKANPAGGLHFMVLIKHYTEERMADDFAEAATDKTEFEEYTHYKANKDELLQAMRDYMEDHGGENGTH